MKKIILLLSATVFCTTSCSFSGDILSKFDGGVITRGEFMSWIEANRYNKKTVMASKKSAKEFLDKFTTERLAIHIANSKGFTDTPVISALIKINSTGAIAHSYFENVVIKNSSLTFPVYRASHIFLRQSPGTDVTTKKNRILELLAKGEKIENLAQKYSDDNTRNKNGDAGYLTEGLLSAEYLNAIQTLKTGEYTKNPVKTSNGIYIIKLREKENYTFAKVSKLKDEGALKIQQFLKKKLYDRYTEELSKTKNSMFNEKALSTFSSKDFVINTESLKMTADDITRLYSHLHAAQPTPANTMRERIRTFAKDIFLMECLYADSQSNNYKADKDIQNMIDTSKNSLVAREWIASETNNNIIISEKEINEEYQKLKKSRYTTQIIKGRNTAGKVIQLSEVRNEIQRKLREQESQKRKKEWKSRAFEQYHVSIN